MRPGRIAKAACWAYAGRKLFELADIVSKAHSQKPTAISPIALRRVIKTPDSDFGENCLEGGLLQYFDEALRFCCGALVRLWPILWQKSQIARR
jgi:hypothetical protein